MTDLNHPSTNKVDRFFDGQKTALACISAALLPAEFEALGIPFDMVTDADEI